MKHKVNQTSINVLLRHVRHILAPNTEVRKVSASVLGVGLYLDSRTGENDKDIVFLSCQPTCPEEGEAEGGWHILARREVDHHLVGEWVAQGENYDADWYAAWFSVMANVTGYINFHYWLRFVEAEAVLGE